MVFLKHRGDFGIDRNWFFAQKDWGCVWRQMLDLVEPRMVTNARDGHPLFRVRIKDFSNQVLRRFT